MNVRGDRLKGILHPAERGFFTARYSPEEWNQTRLARRSCSQTLLLGSGFRSLSTGALKTGISAQFQVLKDENRDDYILVSITTDPRDHDSKGYSENGGKEAKRHIPNITTHYFAFLSLRSSRDSEGKDI